jgi:hypothetical protein
MKPRHRAIRPGDIPECVELIAKHPVIAPYRKSRESQIASDSHFLSIALKKVTA